MNNNLLFNKNITSPKLSKNDIPKIKDSLVDKENKKFLYLNDNLIPENKFSVNIPYSSNSIDVSNKRIRKNYILIDSKFRNKNPSNILDTKYFTLPTNPLSFSTDSSILTINHPKHPFKINDKIILQNITSSFVYLKNSLYLLNNSFFVKINHPNHGISIDTIKYNDIYITISNVIGNNFDKKYLNDIPITLFNTTHKVYLVTSNNQLIDQDYYYIKLPVISTSDYQYTSIISVQFLNIIQNAIPLNLLNSGYPLNINQLIGYHTIINTSPNSYQITLRTNSSKYIQNIGGNNIICYKIIDIIEAYPDSYQYSIILKKSLYNVSSIKLINSSFPKSFYVINNSSNKLYLQISNDSDYIYIASIYQNNYSYSDLIKSIQESINSLSRISISATIHNDFTNKIIEYNPFIISSISGNQFNNLFQLELFQSVKIQNPLFVYSNPSDSIYTYLKINYYNHSLSISDYIYISNAISTDNIPASVINTSHLVHEIIDTNNFIIKLPFFNPDSSTTTNGGKCVEIKTRIKFKLLNNYPDSISKFLGFRNVGNPKSITEFKYIIRNDEPYENDFNYNELGNSIISTDGKIYSHDNIIQNKFQYILISSNIIENHYDNIISINNLRNLIAKIDLVSTSTDNDYVVNTFTNLIDTLSINIPQLNQIDFSLYFPDGTNYDANNMNHSFIIEIIEELDELINSNMITNK